MRLSTMQIRVYSQLEKLWKKHGAHEFGKINQILLGFCLLRLQFKIVIFQLTGRPDILALRSGNTFAFEVKTQSGPEAILKSDDLEGVMEYPEHAIIAVLSYPDLDCCWVLAKANYLRAGKCPIALLKQHSFELLESEINLVFPEVVDDYFLTAEFGTAVLYEEFNKVKKARKSR